MGLAMVYGIVQRHEGTIDIRSEAGEGTTFTIRLPARRGERSGQRTEPSPSLLRALRILVVEDEPTVCGIIAAYLARDGHAVETATSGTEGLKKYMAGQFDLVITDRAMPGLSGDQLTAAVKQKTPDRPVIMLTGFGDMMKAAGEKPEGVDFILAKPVSLDQLRKALAQVMG
jgi:CheY-like chemotaxis protein